MTIYSGLLRVHDNNSRFYSESLKADSIGTAARLLAWRDEWRLGGWDGSANPEHASRIQELAAIEKVALETLPPGEAERLHLVIQALSASGPGPIKSVHLVDQPEDFRFSGGRCSSACQRSKSDFPSHREKANSVRCKSKP